MTRYGTLRTWAAVLKIAGFLMVVLTLFGVVVWAFEVDPDNFVQCQRNLTLWGHRARLRRAAPPDPSAAPQGPAAGRWGGPWSGPGYRRGCRRRT